MNQDLATAAAILAAEILRQGQGVKFIELDDSLISSAFAGAYVAVVAGMREAQKELQQPKK